MAKGKLRPRKFKPKAPEKVQQPLAVAPTRRLFAEHRDDVNPTDYVNDAQCHAYAAFILSGLRDQGEIARRIGCTPRHLRYMSQTPHFDDIYTRLREEHFAKLGEKLLEEKLEDEARIEMGVKRSLTTLFEIQQLVRDRVANKTARATDMRVGVDASLGVIDRSQKFRKQATKAQLHVHQHFAPQAEHAMVIRDASNEAGFSMAKVFDVENLDDGTDDSPAAKGGQGDAGVQGGQAEVVERQPSDEPQAGDGDCAEPGTAREEVG